MRRVSVRWTRIAVETAVAVIGLPNLSRLTQREPQQPSTH